MDKWDAPTDLLFRAGIEQTLTFFPSKFFSTRRGSTEKRKKVTLSGEGSAQSSCSKESSSGGIFLTP